MNQDTFVQLSRIYNTLLTIETKGENTIIMSDCLRAFQNTLQKMQEEQQAEAVESAQ